MVEGLTIPRRPKVAASGPPATDPATNGTTNSTFGPDDTSAAGTKRKRDPVEPPTDSQNAQKLQKIEAKSNGHGSNGAHSVFIEDSADGTIVIDDN